MATLVDLVNQMQALADVIGGANNAATKLVRTTGELVEIGPLTGQAPGQLTLTRPEPVVPTIGFSRGIPLLTGFQPGIDVGPNFLNYASTFFGFGASGFGSATSRISGGPFG